MHRRNNCNWLAASQCSGGKCGHRGVVYSESHLANGIGSGWCHEQKVRLPAHAAKLHMLHLSGDLSDHWMSCRILKGVWVQYLLCRSAHHSMNLGSAPDEVANEIHNAHGCDAACDSYYYGLSRKGIAY